MKRITFFLIFLCFLKTAWSQNSDDPEYYTRFQEIVSQMKNKTFHDAILNINSFLDKYPNTGAMYYNRGLAKLYLNDYVGAKKDFLVAKRSGFEEQNGFITYMTSKNYLVNLITNGFIPKNKLTPDNGYKLKYGLKDSLQGALRPERTCFDVYYYQLTLKVIPDNKSIEGSNQIYFKTVTETDKIQIDLAGHFKIKSIRWQGKELLYERKFNAVFISLGTTVPANQQHHITIDYSGKPAEAIEPPWNGGFVWKKKRFRHWVGVACEHLGASSWWPCKDHLTEKPDSMTINIQIPKGYQGISNGNLRSTKSVGNGYNNFEWFVSYPINSYCVTFYMGKFVNFNDVFTNTNGSYPIDYYVLPHHLTTAKKYYAQTKKILAVYEQLFGEYPYKKDGVAMVEAPYEGMEHQSAIAIGDGYGKEKRRNYETRTYDYLVVHEAAHEWWGNTITMNDMADAWISEGFATYSEFLFIENKFGYEEYLDACAHSMEMIFNIWPVVGPRDVNDNTFLGGDIYNKGAAMLHNLRCIINDDSLFFSMIKTFYTKNKFKTLQTSDFTTFVNSHTGKDYTDFFNKFLYDTIPPILQYEYSLKNDTLVFSYQWTGVGNNFSMPFSITVNDNSNYRLEGTVNTKTFKLPHVESFYLPNEKRMKKNQIKKNSFTYFWTSWKLL